MLRIALTTTAMAALLATGAVAQTAPTTEPATPPAMSAPATGTTPAMPGDAATPAMPGAPATQADGTMMEEGWTATDLATISTDRLVGTDIVNAQDETIAKIDDVLISDANAVEGIVATFGGVLGFGATKVLIQPDEIEVMQDANQMLMVRTSLTPEAIETRPAYEG